MKVGVIDADGHVLEDESFVDYAYQVERVGNQHFLFASDFPHEIGPDPAPGELSAPGAYARPYAAIETRVMGTLNVLECARTFGLSRVVYISTGKTMMTAAAYGRSATGGEIDIKPDPYTSAKVACELICNDYRRMYQLDIVIVRFAGQLFGPGHAFAGAAGQVFKDLIEKPLRGQPVKLNSPYAPYSAKVMGMLYAADAGRGAMMAALADGLRDYVFNIRGQEKMTLWEVTDLLRELIPGSDVEVPRGPEAGAPEELDLRAKEQLGYVPEYSARRGFREYLEFLRTGRWQRVENLVEQVGQ